MRILVVEDDDALRDLLTQRLSAEHYAIDAAQDGESGWEYATTYDYDILVLDLVLPKLSGIALCQKLRQAGQTLPILMLTSQDTSSAKIMGLDAGADDYVVKPFDEAELIARIRALIRRGSSNPLPILTWGDLWLNSSSHEVSYGGTVLDLSAKEYALLEMMMRESQHVFSKEEILDSLWGSEEFPVEATVRSHMRRLRNKLTSAGAPADLIATYHGRGYYLKPYDETHPTPEAPPTKQQQQAQYLEQLDQTWQTHRSRFLEKLEPIRSALYHLQQNRLEAPEQREAHRLAHTLVGSLGTFGLTEAMQIARSIEQELHPDLYPDPSRAKLLQTLLIDLQAWIHNTKSLATLPCPIVPAQSAPLHILLVDDDTTLLQILPKQLQGYGFRVSTLDNPEQVSSVLAQIQPDILILDVQMPYLNGLELCQTLRTESSWQKIPIFFLSAFADAKTQHQAFAAWADDYLCKPITAQDLSDRIQNRLQRIQSLLN
jgi:DNA-binding response OmpR family regulator